jgi:uncharacterized repeat protein (TIGR01451 family)
MNMKKIYLLLVFTSFSLLSNAQMYVAGDINVMPQPMMSHDTNTCSSNINLLYAITISNSFVGDTVKIKDQGSGTLMSMDINTTGANPWYVYLPVMMYNQIINDDWLSGGNANFFGPTVKVICGPDTVFNINNFYGFYVSNPCAYGAVTGRVYVDHNTNCVFDAGDVPLFSIPVDWDENCSSPTMGFATSTGYSDGSGNYNLNIIQSWLVSCLISIPSNYQFIFPLSACSPVNYIFTTVPQVNADFSLQCSSNVDVQCWAGSAGIVRPHVPFNLFPSVSNTGCDSASGQLRLVLDTRVVYDSTLSSTPHPTVSGDTLTWNYANLTNLTSGGYWNSFFANIHLTPITTVVSGDVLCFDVMTNVPAADIDPSNNAYSICLPVVNSYDPNFKEVSPIGTGATGGIIDATDTVLTYTIHFQNTGTADAINIGVVDTLDSEIIPNSLQILGSSHNVSPQWLSSNVVKFNFNSINLPDSTSDEPGSHGSITFRVKRQTGLAVGTQIKNTAEIYFDFNPAIVTNTVLNTIMGPLEVNPISSSKGDIAVYPNPFQEITTFEIRGNETGTYSFELTDVLGKKVKSLNGNSEKQFSVSRTGLENGIYFYKIYNNNQMIGAGKLIIE